MSLQSVLITALQAIGTDTGKIKWLPDEPASAVDGKSYAPFWSGGAWSWSEVPPGSPPLDLFVEGWVSYPMSRIVDVMAVGAPHAAVSIGPENPTVGSVSFESSAANTADLGVPATTGWSGANWQVRRASDAPTAPTIGNNTGRLEVTAFAELPDPSFGEIVSLDLLCKSSLRRNAYWTVSNLTIGNRYYVGFIYATYPNSLTRGTIIDPDDAGDSVTFGVDGVGSILEKGIRRYGFTATATEINFLKYGNDTTGSYCNGMFCLDQGMP